MTGPRRVKDLLDRDESGLAALVRGARRQRELDTVLGGFLDRPLSDHVHVTGSDDGVLVLLADTSVWGHRVRYLAPAILARLREHDPSLRDVRIMVRPAQSTPADPRPLPRRTLSRSVASLLERVAATCDNPKLARILARLGARAR